MHRLFKSGASFVLLLVSSFTACNPAAAPTILSTVSPIPSVTSTEQQALQMILANAGVQESDLVVNEDLDA